MAKYCIELPRNFRHGGGPTRHGMLHPGKYRVPEDISDTLAQRALREAGAKIIDNFVPRRNKPVEKPKRGTSRKKPAPENKALDSAPENKAEFEPSDSYAAPDDSGSLV